MRNFILGTAALLFTAGAAGAADLPVKAMPVKAPPVETDDWTGFYVGGFYGTSIGHTKAHTDPPGTAGTFEGVTNIDTSGVMLGGTAGYNWQFAPHWLVGVEGEFGRLGVDRTFSDWFDPIQIGSKADWYGTLRGRFGYVVGPSLLYVTGGVAFVHVTDTFGGPGGNPLPPSAAVVSATTRTGWTAGGGIETKLSRNWSATAEYEFVNAGSATFGADPYGFVGTPTTFDHSYHLIKTGLNYKLDGHWEGLPLFGAPLLASNHDWGGFYAGANVGGGISLVRTFDVGTSPGGEADVNGTGVSGGGQVGYNYMITRQWFAGIEADVGYLGIHGSNNDWNDYASNFRAETRWYSTARARFGSSTGPALLYVTAGAAWVGLRDGFGPGFNGATIVGDEASRTASGWTVGGGTEVALDSRWSARFESLYIDAGHREHNIVPFAFFSDFKDRFMVVRAGLNLKLGDW